MAATTSTHAGNCDGAHERVGDVIVDRRGVPGRQQQHHYLNALAARAWRW